jgi:hypothetical protein
MPKTLQAVAGSIIASIRSLLQFRPDAKALQATTRPDYRISSASIRLTELARGGCAR